MEPILTPSLLVASRVFAVSCGDKDGNDLNRLRHDPLMKLAIERLPESGKRLASQSTISRLENAPRRTEAARLSAARERKAAEKGDP